MQFIECFYDDICNVVCACMAIGFFVLGAFVSGMLVWHCKPRIDTCSWGCSNCLRRTKKLCIVAYNSSTLDKVRGHMEFLKEEQNLDIEELQLETTDSKPNFSRIKYVLCCVEQTSGRTIILSDNEPEPDQLGAITAHAKKAKAHCAILVLGTRDPPNGQLYDETQLDDLMTSQTRLKEYSDSKRLFSFSSALNDNQKSAIMEWLGLKSQSVNGRNQISDSFVKNPE
ncbi:uncharacterized protein LOC144925214 [Branchiostoma floridae x Branchiostoma belcheri]